MAFKPTRADGKSYRDVAVEFLKEKPPESIVTYKELGDATGLKVSKEKHKVQAVARLANRTLLKVYKRGLKNVAGIGYRVLRAPEHMLVADQHKTKADRQLKQALTFYEGTNLSEMTDGERKLHVGQHMLAQAIYASHRHLDKRLKRIEDIIGDPGESKIIEGSVAS